MYFPNAFKKVFLPATGTVTLASGTTDTLTAGQIGLYSQSWTAITSAPSTNTPFYIVQGSYFTSDKIGPFHGGYKESIKSKLINPKYISRFFTVAAKTPVNQIVSISATGCEVECNTTYNYRIDLKGSPALRFLSHNMYTTLSAFSGCCNDDNDNVDPNVILLQWRDQLANDPRFQGFVTPVVYNSGGTTTTTAGSTASTTLALTTRTNFPVGAKITGVGIPANTFVTASGSGAGNVTLSKAATVANGATVRGYVAIDTATYVPVTGSGVADVTSTLDISVAYMDTKFGYCTFTPTDFFEVEPLFIYGSQVDETGDPCNVNCFPMTETQTPVQAQGTGESLLRELILDGRYRQEAFPDSSHVDHLRMREIEGNPVLSTINRSGYYDKIYLLHSVPRLYNPTGTFDNDQYLIEIAVAAGTTTTALTGIITTILTNAGNGVVLETY